MSGGIWSILPTCADINECELEEKACVGNCINFTPGFTCTCLNGTFGCFAQVSAQTCEATQGITIGVFIGTLSASLVLGALIMFLFTQFVQRKRRSTQQENTRSDIFPESTTHATPNMAYEDAEIVETTLTSSEAYGVAGTADPHNYEFVRP
ncbi:uncharacterized protein LOC135827625 [Sycon ciliatum]|uniref:uncharacterized protein LOC135827625 n=1 Tax=Sycon ciliatum TaxID=27933 RepID=UPI0031F6298A